METELGAETELDFNEDEEEMSNMDGGDEAISLYDVLAERDGCLTEDELWALCRECCLVLEVVNNSPEMFQTLCVTPDTVAFDCAGNVCFLDLDKGKENAELKHFICLFKMRWTFIFACLLLEKQIFFTITVITRENKRYMIQSYDTDLYTNSLEIVQTLGCLRQSSADQESGLVSWKNPEFKTRLNQNSVKPLIG